MKVFLFGLLAILTLNATAQPNATAASKGVYLRLGNEFANNFSYIVARKLSKDRDWKELAKIEFPNSSAALKGRIMAAPLQLLNGVTLSDTVVKVIWRRANGSLFTDSIKPYGDVPLYATALGVGYLDTTATIGAIQYRIYKRNDNGENIDSTTLKIDYLPKKMAGYLEPFYYQAGDEFVSISYNFLGAKKISGLKILRSRFGYKQFEEIPVSTIFYNKHDTIAVSVTDKTAAYKMTYQYIAIPYDDLGNVGEKSDTLTVYNNSRSYDIGYFLSVDANSSEKDKAIKLKWKLSNPGDVAAVKIFKSLSWDGKYIEVASASGKDTTFLDHNVVPMITYFYRFQAQGPYSKSMGSSRVQALMKQPIKNNFPPQNLSATVNGNIVTLKFSKMGHDTRGYYVYKRDGYEGKSIQLQRILLSKDTSLVYIDTIRNTNKSSIITYTVAAINTSYQISPQSDGATIIVSGRIPIASRVNAQMTKNRVIVTWNDVKNENNIAGYKLFRVEKLEHEEKYGEKKLIADLRTESNSFLDSTILEGHHYGYYVQCIGVANNGNDKGGFSPIATIHYNSERILQPENLMANAQNGGITLTWTNPIGVAISKILIYRSKVNEPLTLLKQLNANDTSYDDHSVAKETDYFYTFSLVTDMGKESKQTTPLGVRSK